MSRKIFFIKFLILAFTCIAQLHAQQSDYLSELQEILRTTNNDSTRGHNYLNIAEYYMRRDIDQATLHIDSAKAIKLFANSSTGIGLIKMITGKLWLRKKDNEKALTLLLEAKDQFNTIGDKKLLRHVAYELGSVYLSKGQYLEANESFLESRVYAEKLNDTMDIARSVSALGVIQRRMGNLDQAYAYYQEALPIFQKNNFVNGVSTTLLNLAIIDKRRKNYDSAIDLYAQALDLAQAQDKPNPNLLSAIYGNLSSLHSDKKEYQLALNYGKKSLALREETATSEELTNSYIGLSINSLNLENYADALTYISKAKSTADGNIEALYQITKTESDIYSAQKKYLLSLKALDKSNVYKDSLYNTQKNKQINELNIQYETEKKENEILKLELIEQQNTSKISNQKLAISSLILILSILGFMLYKNIVQKRKISAQNEIIAKALQDKDTLLREIHHRVKNNLQVISSLLFIQSTSLTDEKAKEAIQESRSRVNSMSLIHQNLYKDENLTGIEMSQYLSKLCTNLVSTYDLTDGKIHIQTTVDKLILDVETVVPIGLIVNELITNSLKYAFPNNGTGVVKVQLIETNGALELTVADDGIGLLENKSQNNTSGYGHSLINAFLNKLEATMYIDGHSGTSIKISIRNYKKLN